MELDEFLTENDIPIESVLHDGPPQIDDDPKQRQPHSVSKPMGPPSMVPSPASNSIGTDSNSGSSQIKTESCVNNQQATVAPSMGSAANNGANGGNGFDRSQHDQTPSPTQYGHQKSNKNQKDMEKTNTSLNLGHNPL